MNCAAAIGTKPTCYLDQNVLDFIPKEYILLSLCSSEGAVMRRRTVEQGAVPPDRVSQTRSRGGDGAPRGDTTIPCQELG